MDLNSILHRSRVLNDAGVALLQVNAFGQALDTFREALALVKTDLLTGRATSLSTSSGEDSEERRRAIWRLENLEVMKTRCPLNVCRVDGCFEDVLEGDDCPAKTIFIMHLGEDPTRCPGIQNASLITAVILSNYASSHLCLSLVEGQDRESMKDGAVKLYALAANMLDTFPHHFAQASFAQCGVLKNHLQLFVGSPCEEEYSILERLAALLHVLNEGRCLESNLSLHFLPAAAA